MPCHRMQHAFYRICNNKNVANHPSLKKGPYYYFNLYINVVYFLFINQKRVYNAW